MPSLLSYPYLGMLVCPDPPETMLIISIIKRVGDVRVDVGTIVVVSTGDNNIPSVTNREPAIGATDPPMTDKAPRTMLIMPTVISYSPLFETNLFYLPIS